MKKCGQRVQLGSKFQLCVWSSRGAAVGARRRLASKAGQTDLGEPALLAQGDVRTVNRDLVSAPGLGSPPQGLLSCGEGSAVKAMRPIFFNETHLLLVSILWYYGHDFYLIYCDWQQCAKCSAGCQVKHGCWLLGSELKSEFYRHKILREQRESSEGPRTDNGMQATQTQT